ncbi:MAG: hypothetical protein ACLRSC_00470 [Clostridium perfringens]
MQTLLTMDICESAKEAFNAWLEAREDGEASKAASEKVLEELAGTCSCADEEVKSLLAEIESEKILS